MPCRTPFSFREMRLDPPGGIVKNPFANDIVAIENTTGLPTADGYNDPFRHAGPYQVPGTRSSEVMEQALFDSWRTCGLEFEGRFESSAPPSASLIMTATINLASDRD